VAHGLLLGGWTPDGRLLLFTGTGAQFSPGRFVALDLRSGRRTDVLSSQQLSAYAHARDAQLGDLVYSADGRYLAALAWLPGNRGVGIRAIVIATKGGRIVRFITSTDLIWMFAWSPHGHELAYTTSGWVTWSPDDRWLLFDNEDLGEWDLLRLVGHRQVRLLDAATVPTRRLPRLGGQPLWCCPQERYGGA
jgi:Tol biopolymer transport system component